MDRSRLRTCLAASWALAAAVTACSLGEAAEEPFVDLGSYGERVSREVGQVALESFMASAEAREHFLEVYPAMHHRPSSNELLADLEAQEDLAPLARSIRNVLESELSKDARDARRIRKSWNEEGVQEAVVHAVSSAMAQAMATVSPGQAPSH